MDEGWTRWVFDVNRIPFTHGAWIATCAPADLRAQVRRDHPPGPERDAAARGLGAPYPDSLRGGLGDAGAEALKAFVNAGGTLLAFNDASEYAIETLRSCR